MGNTITKDSIRREFEDLKRDLNEGNIPKVAAEYQKYLNKMQNLPLNIAVTGLPGSGKSSFINAIRGLRENDDKAAKVGIIEQTIEPEAFPHPSFPNILIWDLPGIGTPRFKAKEYLTKVQFEKYDVFIIVTCNRFTENDALLAKEIQRMRKKFYYVRSKIDIDIKNEKAKKNVKMEKTLSAIREYCEGSLKEAAELSARVFLISNHNVHLYDFSLLQKTMAAELPDHKKDILILAVHIFSESELVKKKELMKAYIMKVALVACVYGAVPLPGLSVACEVGILIDALRRFCQVFGLDDQSLRFLAAQTGKEYKQLKSAIKKTLLASMIDEKLVLSLLAKSSLWVTVTCGTGS